MKSIPEKIEPGGLSSEAGSASNIGEDLMEGWK